MMHDRSAALRGPHRRFNPLLREWVTVSPHRLARPWQGQIEPDPADDLPPYDPACYLCPGNARAGGQRNPAYTDTFAFDNDFPALLPPSGEGTASETDELFVARPQAGRCRVLCFSPRHDLTLARMSVRAIRAVVDLWAEETDALGSIDWVRYVQVFENKGAAMGCSNPHPHGQIWASADVPDIPARKLAAQRAYFDRHGHDLLGDYLERELVADERLVCRNDDWAVVVPFWAVWPFETMVVPFRPVADLVSLTDAERDGLADIIRRLCTRYDNLFNCSFPYSMGWHGQPTDGRTHEYCRLHAVYYPPLLRSATVRKFLVGYEMTAEPQRDLTAEEAARRLREQGEDRAQGSGGRDQAARGKAGSRGQGKGTGGDMVTRRVMGLAWGMVSVSLGVALLAAGCGGGGATRPEDVITAEGILEDVRALSADEFEGRAPGTAGEEKTVAYLTRRFRAIGLQPGNPDGTFIQRVPLIAFTSTATGFFDVRGQRTTLVAPVDWVPVARQGLPAVTVDRSAVVFVGYGVEAPEYDWDDFKGSDLRGKTIVMLVGDPPVPDPQDPSRLDAATFKGPAMTYYGRWAYKYEVAARKGAAAAILVHETGPAGYPFDVVQASWARENLGLAGPDEAARHAIIDAWITLDRARELFASAGHSYDELKARAMSRSFEPVDLGTTFSAAVTNAIRRIETSNVIARLPGRDPAVRDEHVMYSAHWDSFGRNATLEGDQIINGALDNGSGMGTMLAIAEAFAAMPEPPRRSLLFLSPTAEEAGMLGSAYYAEQPLWPLERTLADINMDIMNFWGRAAAIVSIGHGMTTLDDLLAGAAAEQARVVLPDPEPEKGYFYRSDHIHLARRGVPALHFLHPGAQYRDRPPGYGQQMRDRYTTQDYHKVTDEVKPDWNLAGAVEDARLLFTVGRMVAEGEVWPEWQEGTEFRAIREAALKR